ncbi:DUF2634 domain-containing protein [Paenibacillus albiflavus]|uniref:DUF2634 domain-containing protein n=1 Tax=Paenibacillus albiflavus TaxID=2545760 RepID=A0A4R4E8Q5_9BACL|nr:DUF2634 domain-containing protein [Paenibacillus albiflavus]TCZ76186.1 DUF2634 domain-containing protein [Paenibacillus albiflavus]
MLSLKVIDGDIVFENGELVTVEGKHEIDQCADRVLSTNIGEWFLNPSHGIDFKALLGKGVTDDEARAVVREGLGQIPEIATVESITINRDRRARELAIYFIATGKDGSRIESGVKVDA